jgi:hypothetical protein
LTGAEKYSKICGSGQAMVHMLVHLLFLAAFLLSTQVVVAGNIRGEQHQGREQQQHDVRRQLYMSSNSKPNTSGRGNNFGFMTGLDDSSNVTSSSTTASCPVCKSFCGEGASRLEVCIIETNVTLCLKKNIYYDSLCDQGVAKCGSCATSTDLANQPSAGPCNDTYLCDSGGTGPRKYQVCRTLDDEGKNITMCVNELSGIFKSKNVVCGACPEKAVSPCAETYRCDANGNGNSNNIARKYQVCRVTNEGTNITVCANENDDIFNSTNTTCGACFANTTSPCAEKYRCDVSGDGKKYQVCRITSEGTNITLCANENSDIFNSTNTTCGACPAKAVSPCAEKYRCDANGNGNGNIPRKFQVCRVTSDGTNITICANENSDIFNSTNTTCGACPAKAVSPCAEKYRCDANGNGNGNIPRKYQVCRVTSEGTNITICANENSDIFNSTNTTCGACPEKAAGPCPEKYRCDSNNGNGNTNVPRRYQVCRVINEGKNSTMCANENSDIFKSGSLTCGACTTAGGTTGTTTNESGGGGENNGNGNNGKK